MNYMLNSALLLGAGTAVATLATADAPHAAPAVEPDSPNIAWVRAVHADGWIFNLKEKGWRVDHAIDADPMELNDYSMRKAGTPGFSDDTDLFISAMRAFERRRALERAG